MGCWMPNEYPGQLERRRCEERTRAELISFPPRRPLSLREEVRIRGMWGKCNKCRACPLMAALTIMLPPSLEPQSGIVLKLAS